MINRKFVAVPLGIAALAVGGASAYGASTVVGSPNQVSTQSNTNSQIGQQSAGGGIVVGDSTQNARNNGTDNQHSGQTVGSGAGSTLVGSANQQNSQGVVGIQSVTQTDGSNNGTVVGNEVQGAANFKTTNQNQNRLDVQTIGFATIVGNPTQGNSQYGGASQGIQQNDPGVLVGDLTQGGPWGRGAGNALNDVDLNQSQQQFIGLDGGSTIVGNPAQSNSQLTNEPQYIGQVGGSGTVVGATTQRQKNDANNTNTYAGIIL